MALFSDSKTSPELEAELQHVIHALPDDDLAALARTESAFLSGGFRASNTAALRIRAFQIVIGPQPLSDAFRRLLVRHSLNRPLVGLLSPATLVDLRNDLAALFGAARVLLAALVDERAEVREAAVRWLQQDAPFAVVEASQAVAHLRERFARLLEAAGATGEASASGAPVTREAWQEARQQLEQQIRDARAEARRLKGVEDRLARTRDQLAARERELAEAKAHQAETETQGRQTARERDAARVELERELKHREERLLAAVEARLAEEAAGWLATAHVAAAAAAEPAAAGEELLARADAALARQAAVDRHSGNRVQLVARLDAVDGRLEQVRDLLANALQPAPELVTAERHLAAEADRLSRLLRRDGDRSPLEAALSARFAAAAPNDLPALRGLAEHLVALGGLETEAAARLIAVLQRRQSLVRATTPPADMGEAVDATTPTGLLRSALGGRGTAVLLVDGHNVLFGLQGRYLPPQGAAVPTAAARERLVEDVVRLTGGRPTCRAWIVFDGPSRSESTAAANVRVTYSGGEGEHRADIALLDNVRFFRGTSGTPVILVSNDTSLCAEARRLGASTLSAGDFGALL